jgi:hypothetical protein
MDHVVTVPAGAEFPLKTGGDFVYLKYATHPVRILVEGDPVTMEAGDKWRVAGGFTQLTLDNPNNQDDCLVRLTIGEGDYNRQIIQGQITVNPGIRTADGEFVEDTRKTLSLTAHIKEALQERVETTEVIKQHTLGDGTESVHGLTVLPNDQALIKGPGETAYRWHLVDLKKGTMEPVGGEQFTDPPVHWVLYRTEALGAYIRDYDENGFVTAWLQPLVDAKWSVFSHGTHGHMDWTRGVFYMAKIYKERKPDPDNQGQYLPDSGTKLGYIEYDAKTLIPIKHWNGNVAYSGFGADPKGNNSGLRGITVLNGYVFIRQNSEFVVMDHETGDLVKRIDDPDGTWDMEPVWHEERETWLIHLFDGASEPKVINARSLVVETGEWMLGALNNGLMGASLASNSKNPPTNTAWTVEHGGTATIKKVALQDFVVTVSGFVQTCQNTLLKPPEKQETHAKVKSRPGPNGTTFVSGEIVKAVLELYTGRAMPDTYMDYVYAIEAENLNFESPAEINGGGMSFAGVGFADNYTGFFPQTLRITIREGVI